MPSLETITKTLDKMSRAELEEHIRKIREQRKIKRRVKKEHTVSGKRKSNSNIKKRFEKMTEAERKALIEILRG